MLSSVPFIYFTGKYRDVKYFLPALVLIGGTKLYASKNFREQLNSQDLMDYLKRSRRLDSDLRKIESTIEKRNLIGKAQAG